ncbi:hypothetical protein [Priestia aryabhattai]|uniref:hypothetical protein n=1 Tax=Priestia aryabhattai TaxID=412384 RepID=UPI00187612BF|nr:hypothetical protein [Priestia aryabhattai]MBE5103298.1 hypothetical protein [Priestia aryabhattai]
MPSFDKNKKERIELFLDKEKDADVIAFLNNSGATRAGLIRHILHEYVTNSKKGTSIYRFRD